MPYYGGVPNAALFAQLYRRPRPNLWPFGQHGSAAPDTPQQQQKQPQKQNAPQNMTALGMQMLYPGQQQQSPLFGALGLNALIQRQRFGMPDDTGQTFNWPWTFGGQ